MFLGGGFFGSGASSSETSSVAKETGQQVQGGQAINLDIDQGGRGSKAQSTINVSATDHGAISDAFEFTAGAFMESLGGIADAQSDAYEFSAGAMKGALDAIGQSQDNVFAFAGGTMESTLSALDAARSDSLEFAAGAMESTGQTIADAMNIVYETNENARFDALSFAAGSLETVLGTIAGTTANTLDSLAAAQSATIETIGEQTKSEAAKSFDRVTTMAGVGFVLVAGLMIYLGSKK